MKQLIFCLIIASYGFGQSNSGPIALHEVKPSHITDLQIGFQGSVPSFSRNLRPGIVLSVNRYYRNQFAFGINAHYTFGQEVSSDTIITILSQTISAGVMSTISSMSIDHIRHQSASIVCNAAYRTNPLLESSFVFRMGLGTGVSMFNSQKKHMNSPSFIDLITRCSAEYEYYRKEKFAFVPAFGFQYRIARKDRVSSNKLSDLDVFVPFFTVTLKFDLGSFI